MKDTPTDAQDSDAKINAKIDAPTGETEEKTTPLRCFIASCISGAIAFCAYSLLTSITNTYATKVITSSNPIVINLTSAVRTMVMGIVALATGVFGMVAIGLFLLGIQIAVQSLKKA
jgi:hypothetical protein